MGGSGGGGFMSSRGTANVLTRATGILAALFFATSLFLSILASYDRKPRSILDGGGTPAAPGAPAVPGARDRRRRAQPAGRRNATARAGGSSRTIRAAGAATVKLPKGRGTGPSLLGEVRCEDVETNCLLAS